LLFGGQRHPAAGLLLSSAGSLRLSLPRLSLLSLTLLLRLRLTLLGLSPLAL
jgi:hypothetical protein